MQIQPIEAVDDVLGKLIAVLRLFTVASILMLVHHLQLQLALLLGRLLGYERRQRRRLGLLDVRGVE